jgi:hypothetical protein
MPEPLILEVLRGKDAGRQITVPASGAVLGRSSDCDITLDEHTVSRTHCRFACENGDWVIEDLGSRSGVIINGQKSSKSPLGQGDRIELGVLLLKVVSLAGPVKGVHFRKPPLREEDEFRQDQRPITRESEPTPQQSEPKEFLSYNAQEKAASTTGTPQLLGIIGSIVLLIGVFMPVVSTSTGGSLNYFQNGKGDGTLVLIVAVISFFLVLIKGYQWLWLTGLGGLGDMLFTFVDVHRRMSQAKTHLADNRFQGAIEHVQLQWGWAVLVVGAGLLIAVAVLDLKEKWYALDPPWAREAN